MLAILERQIVTLFYQRDDNGLPAEWLRKVKQCVARLSPQVEASRMLKEYTTTYYEPAAAASDALNANGHERAKALVHWRRHVRRAWPAVAVSATHLEELPDHGSKLRVHAEVQLGDLDPSDVEVQVAYGPVDADDNLVAPTSTEMALEGDASRPGHRHYVHDLTFERAGNVGFTVRIVPRHPDLLTPAHLGLVAWAPGST
jgi:starch phosphorylase